MAAISEGGYASLGYYHIRLDAPTLGPGSRELSVHQLTTKKHMLLRAIQRGIWCSRQSQIPLEAIRNVAINCKGTATCQG